MTRQEPQGVYVLPLEQTRVDGRPVTSPTLPSRGQMWRWSGAITRLDGPPSVLLLDDPLGDIQFRKRVARVVHRKLDLAPQSVDRSEHSQTHMPEPDGPERGFRVTDGQKTFTVTLILSGDSRTSVLTFPDGLPAPEQDYRVSDVFAPPSVTIQSDSLVDEAFGFTEGTRIRCEGEDRLVEDLSVGDAVATKEGGSQTVAWIGHRRMSGARLFAMPHLRPVRLRPGALGANVPDTDLLVSPQHRVLFEGPQAQALFNQDQVLVCASDLIDDNRVFVDHAVKEVRYIQILLERHSIVWANNVPTESFHPASSRLDSGKPVHKTDLFAVFPEIRHDPHAYGPVARRSLAQSEAAILRHALS